VYTSATLAVMICVLIANGVAGHPTYEVLHPYSGLHYRATISPGWWVLLVVLLGGAILAAYRFLQSLEPVLHDEIETRLCAHVVAFAAAATTFAFFIVGLFLATVQLDAMDEYTPDAAALHATAVLLGIGFVAALVPLVVGLTFAIVRRSLTAIAWTISIIVFGLFFAYATYELVEHATLLGVHHVG
jgi:hypothetical protein